MSKNKKKYSTEMIIILAILISIEIVLSRFLSISSQSIKIGFAFIPVAFAGYNYGKYAGMIVAGIGDIIGAILFPIGTYFPGFTLTAALTGYCFGMFLHNKLSLKNIIFSVLITQIVNSLLLNSLWISMLYSIPYTTLILTRIIQVIIMILVEITTLQIVLKNVDKYVKKSIFQ